MNKPDETAQRLKDKYKGLYGSQLIRIFAHGELVGYDEIEPFKEKFRAQGKQNRIEDVV